MSSQCGRLMEEQHPKPCRLGINGCGRIGRLVLRRALDLPEVEVVAVNDLIEVDDLAYLLKYDSVHGPLVDKVTSDGRWLRVGNRDIHCFAEKEPAKIPWRAMEVDVVIDATGMFRRREAAAGHLQAGAHKVLISAPSESADVTVVPGVNDDMYDPTQHHVISMASCTTNSLAPVAKVLHQEFGIVHLMMTTVHAYTTSQGLLDVPQRKRRRGRAAALSMIPTSTGAAKATELVLPELAGRIDGMAIRVPIPNGSVTDMVVQLGEKADAERINAALRTAAGQLPLRGILAVSDDELVSIDIVGNPHSSIVDAPSTRVLGGTVAKVLAWYDNEWGYASRLVELAARLNSD